MKRTIAVFTAAVLCITAAFGFLLFSFSERSFRNEMYTVYGLCGAFIAEYPGSEKAAVSALNGEAGEYTEIGQTVLARYGYGADRSVISDPEYRRTIILELSFAAVFALSALTCGALFLKYIEQRKKEQDDIIVSVLDKCVSGSLEIEDLENAYNIKNDLISDELVKVCEGMKLRSDILDEERDNTKSLVTDISHQLKTPLSALKSCFSVYKDSMHDAEREEFINRCETQINKLEALTGSLISISRLETGMITLEPREVSITEILIQAVNSVYYKAADKNIDIVTEELEDITITADKKWTAEAIANILDNAVKYSPAGTEIKIWVAKMFSFVRIEIEDQGAGIPREERNKIFERFYRGSGDIVKNEDGTGVGLYLARRLIEDQGGTVSVRSASGGGSIFVVQLIL